MCVAQIWTVGDVKVVCLPLLGFSVLAFLNRFTTAFLGIVGDVMTMELLQVGKLWFVVGKDIFSVMHLAQKILIAENCLLLIIII